MARRPKHRGPVGGIIKGVMQNGVAMLPMSEPTAYAGIAVRADPLAQQLRTVGKYLKQSGGRIIVARNEFRDLCLHVRDMPLRASS